MEITTTRDLLRRLEQILGRQATALEQLAAILAKLNEKIGGSEWWGRGI